MSWFRKRSETPMELYARLPGPVYAHVRGYHDCMCITGWEIKSEEYVTITTAALIAGALACAPTANAADAYMNGLFGTAPGYATITGPQGQKCAAGCSQVTYDNFSVQSGEAAAIKWLTAHQGEANTFWTYSESSQAIINVANKRPDLMTNTTVIALAPPKVGSIGYADVKAPSTVNITKVIAQGDSVSDPTGTNFSTHLNGYKNLNMQTQAPITSVAKPGTNTKTNTYGKPVVAPTTPVTTPAKPVKFNLFNPATWGIKPAVKPVVKTTAKTAETASTDTKTVAVKSTAKTRQAERAQARADRKAARDAKKDRG